MKSLFITFLAAVFALPAWSFTEQSTLLDVQAVFASEVGGVEIDSDYRQQVARQAGSLIRENNAKFGESQFFLLVDRNHDVQKAFLAFYDAEDGKVLILGADNASTGNPLRRGYFETPIGVFENKPANMSYRALGTKNKLGWRGLGAKGSRVWDLGWQRTVKNRGEPMDIRMLVHATDPDQGEKRLGTVQSKGCIRLSARFNKFLDQYGILDRAYEESAKARYVLPATRDPIPLAGKFVVVIDSGVSEQPAV